MICFFQYANTPWSLQQILLYVKETYGNPPVYILENGLSLSLSASLRL